MIVGALALLCAVAGSAHARPDVKPPRAVQLFHDGVDALKANDAELAATLFQKAYELDPKAGTMCNLALSYERWAGHDREAVSAYRRCAEEDASGKFREHALERARALDERIAAAAPPPRRQPPPPATNDEAERAPPPRRQPPPPTEESAPPPRQPIQQAAAHPAPAEPAPEGRSHGLLFAGIGFVVAAAACAIISAAVLVPTSTNDAQLLQSKYGDPNNPTAPIVIPAGSDDAKTLSDARLASGAAWALYAAAGVLGAAGVTLAIVDLTRGGSPSHSEARIGVSPQPGGAMVVGSLRF